jgi:hypothetical protein
VQSACAVAGSMLTRSRRPESQNTFNEEERYDNILFDFLRICFGLAYCSIPLSWVRIVVGSYGVAYIHDDWSKSLRTIEENRLSSFQLCFLCSLSVYPRCSMLHI